MADGTNMTDDDDDDDVEKENVVTVVEIHRISDENEEEEEDLSLFKSLSPSQHKSNDGRYFLCTSSLLYSRGRGRERGVKECCYEGIIGKNVYQIVCSLNWGGLVGVALDCYLTMLY